jgi:hypothetical protein
MRQKADSPQRSGRVTARIRGDDRDRVPRTAAAGTGRAVPGRARSMLLPHERDRGVQEPSGSGARRWRLHMPLR